MIKWQYSKFFEIFLLLHCIASRKLINFCLKHFFCQIIASAKKIVGGTPCIYCSQKLGDISRWIRSDKKQKYLIFFFFIKQERKKCKRQVKENCSCLIKKKKNQLLLFFYRFVFISITSPNFREQRTSRICENYFELGKEQGVASTSRWKDENWTRVELFETCRLVSIVPPYFATDETFVLLFVAKTRERKERWK